MAATGYTPISLYYSTTAATAPLAANLVNGELAINITDGKLYYKDNAGVVQIIAGKGGAGVAGGSNTQVQYNSSGSLAGSANMTFNGTSLTLANDASISGLTVGKGGGSVASNTGFGYFSLLNNTSGSSNTALGYIALAQNTTGSNNAAVGNNSLYANTTGSNNSAFGVTALTTNSTGSYNSAFGLGALAANTTASNNTAVGYQAGYSNTTGSPFDAFGYQAGYSNTTGVYNASFGYQAGKANTTGLFNCAFGANSLLNNSGTTANNAFGVSALQANTTGNYNCAFGKDALLSNTTASNNTAVGYQAGYTNSTATGQTFIGYQAGYTSNGNYNTCIGEAAGYSLTTGVGNCFVSSGYSAAGYTVTTGSYNTVLGGFNGNQGGLNISTSSNYIVLSDGAGNPKFYLGGTTAFFRTDTGTARGLQTDASQTYPSADNTMSLGLASFRWSVVYAATALINTSDANLKQDIAELDDAEKRVAIRIKSLIKKYRFKDSVAEKGDSARIHIGVIAQEVQAAFTAEGLDSAQYALFCSDTWYVIDGKRSEVADEPFTQDTPNAVAVTQLGIRYDELLAFVISTL